MDVARRLAAVEAALGSDDLAGARSAVARLAEVAPDHPQLGALQARLDQALAAAARRQRLLEIATAVRGHLGRDDVEAAAAAIAEAVALDGDDPEIQALAARTAARREEAEQAARTALQQRIARGQARLEAGDVAGAVAHFEALLAEQPSAEAAVHGLAEARTRRAALDAEDKEAAQQAALDARVAEGRLRLSQGDLAGAIAQFEAVLRDDLGHAGAQQGLAAATERRSDLEAREAAAERRTALDARVAEARLRLEAGDLAGALTQLEGVLAEEPGHAEAQRGLTDARARREALERQVAAARRAAQRDATLDAGRRRLAEGDLAGAIERFESVLAEETDHAEARRALADARRRLETIGLEVAAAAQRMALDARVAAARSRLDGGDLQGAIERFERVLKDDSTHADARRGLDEARARAAAREVEEREAAHRAALDARVAEGAARLAAGDAGGAIERLEAVLRDDPAHSAAQQALAQARERWTALLAQVTEARARLAAGDAGAAIGLFEAVLGQDAAHEAARRGLAEARQREAARQARDAEIATARAALDAALGGSDVGLVEAAFAWLVDLAPDHPQLALLREKIAEHRERVEEDREQAAREALADAGRLIREGQVDRALEGLARVRELAPGHPDLPKLERQAQRLAAARAERVHALVTSAAQLLERDDVDAARRALQEALGMDASSAEARAGLESVEARARELELARRVEALVAETRRLVDTGEPEAARARVEELRQLAPGHPELEDLAARVAEAARAKAALSDPETIVRLALEEAARLFREGRPERVAEPLARVRAHAPDHPQLAKLEAQAQKLVEARDVRLRVRTLLDRARKLQVRNEFEEALALAEEAVALAPDDGWATRLRDDLADQLQEARRQGRPVRAANPAPAAPAAPARSPERDRAAALLATARERLGRDDLPAAKEAVDQALALVPGDAEARTLQERVQAREREVVVGRVRAALDAADPVAAQAALIRLAAVTPQHPELPALRARLTEVRDRVVREALAEADKGLRDGALDRLSAALGRVRAVAPDHPQLAKLEAQAQRVAEARDAGSRVRALLDRAQKLALAGDLRQALAAAEEAVAAAPNDARALRLRDSLAEQLQRGGKGKSR